MKCAYFKRKINHSREKSKQYDEIINIFFYSFSFGLLVSLHNQYARLHLLRFPGKERKALVLPLYLSFRSFFRLLIISPKGAQPLNSPAAVRRLLCCFAPLGEIVPSLPGSSLKVGASSSPPPLRMQEL